LAGGVLILNESGEEKAGKLGAGLARQYNNRHRQVEQCQVAVFLAHAAQRCWTWLDGELYLPERWFSANYATRRSRSPKPAPIQQED
jgi:SRSO17 transposase